MNVLVQPVHYIVHSIWKVCQHTYYFDFSTALSSFDPPPMPMVLQQSYIFPTTIRTATVTITERGITHKNLLFGLQTGYILSLPKNYLDPRRKFVPAAQDREEGLHPYVPELTLNPLAFINYNQTGEQNFVT